MYSKIISKIHYKVLMVIPLAVAIIMAAVVAINGIQMTFEFSGGMSLEIYEKLSEEQMAELYNGIMKSNLENLRFSYDGYRVKITTTSKISDSEFLSIAEKYTGDLNTKSIFIVNLNYKISPDAHERLEKRFGNEIKIKIDEKGTNIIIERRYMDEKEMKEILSYYDIDFERGNYSFKKANANVGFVSPVLGARLKEEATWAFVLAVILISIVVFIAYNTPFPTIAILGAVFVDITFAVGCMSIFGIELNLPTLLALVMLLGYTVDTNILLTTRVLKRKTSVNETIDEAMKTGLTMTFTAIGAAITIFIVSNLTTPKIEVLSQLSLVIVCGLFMDIFSTWFMNAGMLKWYVERKKIIRKKKLFKFSLFHE